jgi:topoisomerase-4 subunit A
LSNFDLSTHFDEDLIHIEKWHPDRPISCVYYDPDKDLRFVKRFLCEVTTDKMVSYLPEVENVRLDVVSTAYKPEVTIIFNKLLKATKNLPDKVVELSEFIEVKGMKAIGNQLTKLKTKEIQLNGPIEGTEPWPEPEKQIAPENDDDETTDTEFEQINAPDDDAPFEIEWTVGDVKKDEDAKNEDENRDEPPQMTLF